MKPPAPSVTGNTTFKLPGHTDAEAVAIYGSFNNWIQTKNYTHLIKKQDQRSERQVADDIYPLVVFAAGDQQIQLFDHLMERQGAGRDEQSSDCFALSYEIGGVDRHCPAVVRYDDASFLRRHTSSSGSDASLMPISKAVTASRSGTRRISPRSMS